MKLRIVNKNKVIRNIIILNIIILGIIFFNNISLSSTKINYKTIYISQGDTLWSIAKEEQEKNEYFKNKDIREIIYQIKEINQLKSSYLLSNQKLEIPIVY